MECESYYCSNYAGDNLCVANNCEHICLLSSVEAQGWSCVCETGYILNEDQTTCSGELLFLVFCVQRALSGGQYCTLRIIIAHTVKCILI